MPSRLIIALALSLALHGVLFVPDLLERQTVARPRPALEAMLRLPPEPEEAATPADPLLKNTIDADTSEVEKPPPVPHTETKKAKIDTRAETKRELQAARRKLSKYIFYPEEARQRGYEGTVQLYVELSNDGSVEDVRVVVSSGYTILDNAAIKGFYAVGKLPGGSDTWYYTFHLQ